MGPAKQPLQATKLLTPIPFANANGTYSSVRKTVTEGTPCIRAILLVEGFRIPAGMNGLGKALVVGRYGLCDLWASLLPDVRQSQGGNWFKQIEAA